MDIADNTFSDSYGKRQHGCQMMVSSSSCGGSGPLAADRVRLQSNSMHILRDAAYAAETPSIRGLKARLLCRPMHLIHAPVPFYQKVGPRPGNCGSAIALQISGPAAFQHKSLHHHKACVPVGEQC